jgi:acyl-coenzyme A thioesterase 13
MHVSFLSAKAKVGDVVVIEGTIDRVGRNLAYTSVRIIKEGTDEVITLASHTKFVG